MSQPTKPTWLTGLATLTPVQLGSDKSLQLDLYLPFQSNVTVTVRPLDSDRQLLWDLSGRPVKPVIVVATQNSTAEPRELESRIWEVFDEIQLHRTTCSLIAPNMELSSAAFIQLDFEKADAADSGTPGTKKPEDRICLEIPKRTLARISKPTLFWLLTRGQANNRIEAIARKHGLFDRDDDATNDALVKLIFDILSGADSPLLTESLEDDNDE